MSTLYLRCSDADCKWSCVFDRTNLREDQTVVIRHAYPSHRAGKNRDEWETRES